MIALFGFICGSHHWVIIYTRGCPGRRDILNVDLCTFAWACESGGFVVIVIFFVVIVKITFPVIKTKFRRVRFFFFLAFIGNRFHRENLHFRIPIVLWRRGRTKVMVRISKGTGNHDVCKTHTCAINFGASIEATQKHIRHALGYSAVIPSACERHETQLGKRGAQYRNSIYNYRMMPVCLILCYRKSIQLRCRCIYKYPGFKINCYSEIYFPNCDAR